MCVPFSLSAFEVLALFFLQQLSCLVLLTPNCTSTQIFHFKEHRDLSVTLGEFQMFVLFILEVLLRAYRLTNVTEIFFFPLMMNIMFILFNGLCSTE